ncbi:MAG: M24 family metallopeptidase, partial [Anaerolineales bacterium]
VLFHGNMEREEADRTGFATHNLGRYPTEELLRRAGGDPIEAQAQRLAQILDEYSVRGRMAAYGIVEAGPLYTLLRRVQELVPAIEVVGEAGDRSVVIRARASKDADEVDRIREMGRVTTEVAGEVAEYLRSQRTENGALVDRRRRPLMVGDVKRRIDLWLAERGAENPEGTIFAVGRDAGIPHSAGQDGDPIHLGATIVFDLFPCEAGGGYFYDFTRTWCLGSAPPEAERAHEQVLEAYQAAVAGLRPGVRCREVQLETCAFFRARGHLTILEKSDAQEGYVHGLGHGVGLAIHESPSFSHVESNQDVLAPGAVVTIEPGLYYPEKGYGVRVEDTWWLRPDGKPERLAEYPTDLILPVKSARRTRARRRSNGRPQRAQR